MSASDSFPSPSIHPGVHRRAHPLDELRGALYKELVWGRSLILDGRRSYNSALFSSLMTSASIKTFLRETDSYDSTLQQWKTLPTTFRSLNALCNSIAITIQAILDHFRIPHRRVLSRRTRKKEHYLSMEPEVMIVGCCGTAFKNREFPVHPNYHDCVTAISVRFNSKLNEQEEKLQAGIFAQYVYFYSQPSIIALFLIYGVSFVLISRKCFGAQPHRRFVYTMNMTETNFVLFQFDRTGAVYSRRSATHEQAEEFVRFVLGVASVDENLLGFDTTIKWRGRSRYIQTVDETAQPVEYEFDVKTNPVHYSGILGRGTICWSVMTVKDGWSRAHGDCWTGGKKRSF
ncbi:hypothetical protein AX16_008704 [Volvariella volvacea WC 439]|nr:hypothetical protein AX16_008704 [Volvariella volvacea WC 439]